ncbi:Retrovirus-related Pol polyprotein from type-1 retrotransposable element R2 [Chionoecetes opilio]|uniref:Retrovirus-related Pol polyprotein from type-1 retrotransposable element R2 n=1 Tax=Chionoecetes opilio TaxID=41210 RepID=A0A8J4XWQ7_CHIOP|nr:Retrovirus-related Pol polyprotein from type-1 retrotransposable element R2 [Chionoecetes opilio]
MLAAYVDLKKAFDSVHRESLWDLLRLRGIPARTIGLITGLYSGTESAVKCGAGVSSFFPVNTGVRQGCVLAPSLFNACMDWVLDKVVDQSDCGASVGNTKITDLVFADDAVIFAESLEVLVMALEALHEEAKPLGLEFSWLKTKVQSAQEWEADVARETAVMWNSNLPAPDRLQLDCGKVEQIKSAMASFTLPQSAIPPWAQNLSDEEWKSQVSSLLGQRDCQ